MSEKPRPKPPLDAVGKLIFEGKDVADYLFQVPDDDRQRARLRTILQGIAEEAKSGNHRELPRIALEILETLQQPPSPQGAELAQAGFDRLARLWEAARSGLF